AANGADAEAAARRLGPRVVLKIRSRRILHKSDLGGVKVGVAPDEVDACCHEMLARLRAAAAPEPEGFLVQELIEGGVEMILVVRRAPLVQSSCSGWAASRSTSSTPLRSGCCPSAAATLKR